MDLKSFSPPATFPSKDMVLATPLKAIGHYKPEQSHKKLTESNLPLFRYFPKLPTELQVEIWNHALPGPRVIEVEWCHERSQWYCVMESSQAHSYFGLLLACHQSRHEFLNEYCPFLKQELSSEPNTTKCQHKFWSDSISYFNPKIDILYIGTRSEEQGTLNLSSIHALDTVPLISELRIVAFNSDTWGGISNQDFLSKFPALETFMSITKDLGTHAGLAEQISFVPVEGDLDYCCDSCREDGMTLTMYEESYFKELLEEVGNQDLVKKPNLRVMQVQRGLP